MITSFFSKSKPINFIIIVLLVVITFVFHSYFQIDSGEFSFLKMILPLLIALFYVFLTDFIIYKNDLTKRHSYGIMILGIMIIVFPEIFNDSKSLIANLLVLFGLRRLFSLHTKKSLLKKFFDAVFWISLASLFYAWSMVYLILVVVALANYWQSEVKYIAVSIFGVITVFILLLVFNILVKDVYVLQSNFDFDYNFNFSAYNSRWKILRLTLVISTFLWSIVFYLKAISNKNRKQKPIHILVLVAAILSILIVVLAPKKSGSEFIFFIVPFSVIIANYLETVEEKWFKEVFIFLLLLIPVSSLFL
ncbi:MAG: hypothetical protein HKP48_09070 [Winogradskyella sp.]|uniref:DUF6427 family protein n=1 Tax=Winogradskyella sp. TaxID=1883156 RepID=UPI00182109B4|nr:DUF6427 family protein [Winogradskyella sp.]MBT8243814.1 hypothetical protein [Winogradskyella sp.]NNK23422.1 hypothetical protein [Winogradskyella sp.]